MRAMLRFSNPINWPLYAIVLSVLIAGGHAVWPPLVYLASCSAALQAVVIALASWDVIEASDAQPLIRESGKVVAGSELRSVRVLHLGAATLYLGLVGAALWHAFF